MADYITKYWKLVKLARDAAALKRGGCPICLLSRCQCGNGHIDYQGVLATSRWWREIMVMRRDRNKTLITENFLYPRFPTESCVQPGTKSFYCFAVIDPILTLVVEKNYCAVYGEGDTPLDVKFHKPRLGHGAYYGTFVKGGGFKAMASFRNGIWSKMGSLHTLPYIKTHNALPPHTICVPANRMAHDDFGVLWT